MHVCRHTTKYAYASAKQTLTINMTMNFQKNWAFYFEDDAFAEFVTSVIDNGQKSPNFS